MHYVDKVAYWTANMLLLIQFLICGVIIKTKQFIPTHWNIDGRVDSYGVCYDILWIPAISISVWIMFRYIKEHPEYWNIPESKEIRKVVPIIKEMFDVMLMLIMGIMTNICHCAWKHHQLKYIWIEILLVVFTTIYYVIRTYRS